MNKRFMVYTWREAEDGTIFDHHVTEWDTLLGNEFGRSGEFISIVDTHIIQPDGEPKLVMSGMKL